MPKIKKDIDLCSLVTYGFKLDETSKQYTHKSTVVTKASDDSWSNTFRYEFDIDCETREIYIIASCFIHQKDNYNVYEELAETPVSEEHLQLFIKLIQDNLVDY